MNPRVMNVKPRKDFNWSSYSQEVKSESMTMVIGYGPDLRHIST